MAEPNKAPKLEQRTECRAGLADFKIDRELSGSAVSKTLTLLGSFEGMEGQVIVILARRHFPVDPEACATMLAASSLKETFTNDIYAKVLPTAAQHRITYLQFEGALSSADAAINVDIIHPCTARHISKYSAQKSFVIVETPEMYEAVTRPHIASIPPAAIQWVYNILEKKKETERLLFEDPDPELGFMLHPDQKWDQSQVDSLYCLAIIHRRDVRSLRDLRPAHLLLLRNILTKGSAAIHDKFGVAKDQLRVYVHYIPSYYHLHMHFVHASHDASFGMAVGKGHALEDVISNLELFPDYYQRSQLTCALGQNDPLYAKLAAHASAA